MAGAGLQLTSSDEVGADRVARRNTKRSLERKASGASVGSADSFSFSSKRCRVGFEPAFGELLPGRCASIAVRHVAISVNDFDVAIVMHDSGAARERLRVRFGCEA